jgi:predicted nucleic-acid-binding protein
LTVEHAEIIWQAPRKFVANKADVADGPIERCGHASGCMYTATFVLNAIKTTGMKRLAWNRRVAAAGGLW